ncbi:hypothetical protein [Sphaerisporangium perillae]|uniref:hypothetical protein n=1 Tax=Sphaerisporangium perillae TaxID=2935860 RepID=UPI00200F85E0|nr:hypothetical protein [Sphaerisporangium perillae]
MPDSHLARLTAEVGRRLAALPCELVWATTWEDEANAEIAPRIGLPQLPVVNWPESSDEDERQDQWFGLHWKTRTLVTWAAGRPFAWVDDEITDADRDWVTAHRAPRTIAAELSSTTWSHSEDSPTKTSQSSTNGFELCKSRNPQDLTIARPCGLATATP